MLKEILTARTRPSDKALYNIWARKISGGWTETTITGSLPLTFQAKGGDLTDYTVHGTAEGAGAQTANLLNDALATKNVPVISNDVRRYMEVTGYSGVFIPVEPSTRYTGWNLAASLTANNRYVFFCDAELNIIGNQPNSVTFNPKAINTTANTTYICVPVRDTKLGVAAMVTKGSTEPAQYIPYGCQIPLTVTSGQNTDTYPLYIGDTKLGAEEYVDYGEQKIYKDVSGTLTPTDPPLPFPAISAYQGENTLSSTETVGSVSLTGKIKEVAP